MTSVDSSLRELRDEIAAARSETQGVRNEVRMGLQKLAATWAEDARERHELSEAIKEIARTTKRHEDELAALRMKQLDDEHEKIRGRTAMAIFRVGGGILLSLALTLCGYLFRSYIEVRDQTREHSTQIAAIRESDTRAERERAAMNASHRTTHDEVIQVRTRLHSIDSSLQRIEDALHPRRR